ncbi:hypothetical protein SAMN05216241_10567 [Limimonas halophila]|uniref:Uncharacterized protein n=1 Tax=Limimonas halophila TaxID=1082479 RepID=A0A1G7RCY0_9PROT|nr:hypothetical protein [Limimonas halophila]SDG08039.1 hypothetical protein SAMN05216241_10567 [Limimonas halophila]
MAASQRPADPGRPCSALAVLAPDVQAIVQAECPRCKGIGPDCIAERLWELAAADCVPPRSTTLQRLRRPEDDT